jgi:vacuolar-type H+-ATPase subunit I/STV1
LGDALGEEGHQDKAEDVSYLGEEELERFDRVSELQSVKQRDEQSDNRSVYSELRSVRTGKSSLAKISRLESELQIEREEREKLRKEIEDLKKVNSELCSVIVT